MSPILPFQVSSYSPGTYGWWPAAKNASRSAWSCSQQAFFHSLRRALIGSGSAITDASGWWLWLLTWLQSAASIFYAYLRLEQRLLPSVPPRRIQWSMAVRALAFTSFNVLFSFAFGLVGQLPRLIFIPYLLQWIESLWGALHPAIRVKPVRIGLRQLVVSILWTILFIILWLRS